MAPDYKHSGDSAPHPEEDEKPCRACMDFRSWLRLKNKASKAQPTNEEGSDGGIFQKFRMSSSEDDYRGSRWFKKKSEAVSEKADADDEREPKLIGLAAKYGCPSDSLSLGRGTWRLLHTMASYCPENPSPAYQTDMKHFITLFSKLYPCKPCAEDFREWIEKNPPEVNSKKSLERWFCNAHNEVNIKLGKTPFDCNLVDQRWGSGWKDGSCD